MVLLCSHYERFIYAINEEATDFVNSLSLPSEKVPRKLRLLQSRGAIEQLALKQWDNRAEQLTEFASLYACMWQEGVPVDNLVASAHLEWMKSPKVKDVIRYFEMFDMRDVFASVTRTDQGRRRLARNLQSLVDARNGIAHGDRTVQPQPTEVTEYIRVVVDFASRVDRAFARNLSQIGACSVPW